MAGLSNTTILSSDSIFFLCALKKAFFSLSCNIISFAVILLTATAGAELVPPEKNKSMMDCHYSKIKLIFALLKDYPCITGA